MSNKVPRVFISATSRDLGSYRKAVSEVLVTLGALPVVQNHFGPDYRSVVEMLREKVGGCDAAICLVGRHYGAEPQSRASDQPRRSYTQLEYEIAVELGKRVYVFVAGEDCPPDHPADEPDVLRGLQLEHVKRVVATDTLWMPFRSLAHLTDQVRVMRFDPRSLAEGVSRQLVVLLRAELIDEAGEGARARRGDVAWVREVVRPFQSLLQEVLERRGGRLQSETDSEYEANFETADAAVNAALALHQGLHGLDWHGPAPGLRVGIHVGQIVRFGGADETREIQVGQATEVCRRVVRLAAPGQTLLTRGAFDIAREYVRPDPSAGEDGAAELRWLSHGRYLLADLEESQEICEVGLAGQAGLTAPPSSADARRADSLEESQMQGWRPGLGQEVPRRLGWIVERKLGEGGFGEVWMARHVRTKELRVFKFCFDPSRLTSFKRELTLFKLLRDALGQREDIARLLEVELDEAPFYLESEYVEGGNLRDWGMTDGHLAALPLEERLRLVSEIAGAVAAAHSVGIIHKDLKPSNIFMRQAVDGRWHPMLADFGIGAVADRSQLEQRGITVAGFTQSLLEPGSSRTGTRMYQPPEANLARPATVQGDVYALGVLLFQMIVGDFDQPLGHGWERRLEAARGTGFQPVLESSRTGFQPVLEKTTGKMPVPWTREGEAPSEPGRPTALAPTSPAVRPLRALDPSAERLFRLLRDDIGDCVDGDPSVRLTSAAQLVDRLREMDKRIADGLARSRVERARIRMRRLRAALAVSVAALVVVCCLGAFAFIEWRRAEALKKVAVEARTIADQNAERATENEQRARENERQATRNEQRAVQNEQRAEESAKLAKANAEAAKQQSQLALDTLNAVIFDIQSSVADLPGSSPIRGRLLKTALEQLEKLSGEFVQHSTADRQTAVALLKMGHLVLDFGEEPEGRIQARAAGPHGGESRSAAESARRFFMRSMEICQAMARADRGDSQAKRDLSDSYIGLGDVYMRLGASEKALPAYEKGLELRADLAEADPHDARAKRDLSVSYDKLGTVHLRRGATNQALDAYQKERNLDEVRVKADPDDAEAKKDLAISYDNLGDTQLSMDALDEARQSYEKGLQLREALVKADPNDIKAKRNLFISHNNLGVVYSSLGAYDKALLAYEKGSALFQAMAKADPSNHHAKRLLFKSYNNLGHAHLHLGAADKALPPYEKALELSEALVKADPNDTQARDDLARSHRNLGNAHLELGAIDKAFRHHQKGVEVLEALAQVDPKNSETKSDLANSYDGVGNVHLEQGATDKALQAYQKGLDLHEVIARAHPEHMQTQGDLSSSYDNMARAHERANDYVGARKWDEKMLAIDRQISERTPRSADARREVAADCETLSQDCARIGDWPAAVSYARQALEHARTAQGLVGTTQPFRWDFAKTFQALADAQIRASEFIEARKSIEEAIKAGPQSASAYSSSAWLLATCWEDSIRDGRRAIELATKACESTEWKNLLYVDTLAAAYAETGQFDEALKWQKKALEHPEAFDAASLEQSRQRLKLYEARKPYHQPRPNPPGPAAPDRAPER